MNPPTPVHILRFGMFELDTDSGELRRHGLKIRLPDQSFQILRELLSRHGDGRQWRHGQDQDQHRRPLGAAPRRTAGLPM
jgi:hypothetical protein